MAAFLTGCKFYEGMDTVSIGQWGVPTVNTVSIKVPLKWKDQQYMSSVEVGFNFYSIIL